MALFNNSLVREVTALVRKRYEELGEALGEQATAERTDATQADGSLQRDLRLLISVANGEHNKTDVMVRKAELALTRVLGLLFGSTMGGSATLPDNFWRTEMGTVVSRVRWWISIDDLITISNAAALAFGENTQASRMRISRAIDNGLLEWVIDPSVSNPHHNKRVLRPQVERLRELNSLPE